MSLEVYGWHVGDLGFKIDDLSAFRVARIIIDNGGASLETLEGEVLFPINVCRTLRDARKCYYERKLTKAESGDPEDLKACIQECVEAGYMWAREAVMGGASVVVLYYPKPGETPGERKG